MKYIVQRKKIKEKNKFMREKDFEIDNILEKIQKLEPRQYSLTSQLSYLSKLAVKFGLYDADDYLKINMSAKGLKCK